MEMQTALTNPEVHNYAEAIAKKLATSSMIPASFQGKPQDCLIALIMADQLKVNPVTLMQEMYVVHGRPALSAKFLISLAHKHGVFKSHIGYEVTGKGDDLAVKAYATMHDGSTAETTVSMKMAAMEGWSKKNTKYQSMPEHMLKMRAASFLVRQYCPEITMGFTTKEEVEDVAAHVISAKPVVAITETIGPDSAQTEKMFAAFAAKGYSDAEVLQAVAKESREELTTADLAALREIYKTAETKPAT